MTFNKNFDIKTKSDIEIHTAASGTIYHYKGNVLHREDGPAAIYANGEKHYYIMGALHRMDGPAIEAGNGIYEWWINDEYIDVSTQRDFEKYLAFLAFI
jgi:hypothetical protein